jgi:16S rRNA (uracil1498-N3)-methyltransferase
VPAALPDNIFLHKISVMSLPLFYINDFDPDQSVITLDEDTSKHVVNVLRMKTGAPLHCTDGKGNLLVAEIMDTGKKKCTIKVVAVRFEQPSSQKIIIAISILKNAGRFEWFLEKATEIGVTEIVPMVCDRTEKQQFRYDRMNNILISAMLQSQQTWLPLLHKPIGFGQLLRQEEIIKADQKFIAHCLSDQKMSLVSQVNQSLPNKVILIGPEGDFTKEEIDFALSHNYVPVALGNNRLRSETAGVVAATILKLEG